MLVGAANDAAATSWGRRPSLPPDQCTTRYGANWSFDSITGDALPGLRDPQGLAPGAAIGWARSFAYGGGRVTA